MATESRARRCTMRCMLLAAAVAAPAALVTGCPSPGDKQGRAPTVTVPESQAVESQIVESQVVEIDDASTAHASRWADGRVRVEIRGTHAGLQFAAEFRNTDNDKVVVDYALYLASAEENMSPQAESSSLELPMTEPPPLDHAITSAVFIHTQFSKAVLGLYDNWGCDLLPGRFNWVASCGPKGRCCDIHDACYKRHGCKASSWRSPPWNKCQRRCNAPAVACFLRPGAAGPSVCCARGNCGRPR